MYIDAREIDNNSIIEGDVCIVGAGAAGISIALDWLNSSKKIILLEGGGFDYDDKVQQLSRGLNTGHNYFPLQSTRLHQFGGTSAIWGGECTTMDEIDFEKRDWVEHSGWPISKKDLDPYYRKAHKILDLGPYEYDSKLLNNYNNMKSSIQIDHNLFWNKIWRFSPPTRFSDKYKETIKKAENIYLYTYAKTSNISGNHDISKIKEVTIKNHAGKTHAVTAKVFILACGAIQNARLLLASNKQSSKGIGNNNDNVGKYFMEHLEIGSAGIWFKKEIDMELYTRREVTNLRNEIAVKENIQKTLKILNGTISFLPMDNFKLNIPKMKKWANDNPFENIEKKEYSIKDRIENKIRKFNVRNEPNIERAYKAFIRMEQAPNPDSFVYLDKSEIDSLGMPRANLNWGFTSLEKRSIYNVMEMFGINIGKTDIGRLKLDEYIRDKYDPSQKKFTGAWHHMGTTRMSSDEKTGVVDKNCKVHGIDNLFIAGSSCFATSGCANPTLTLMALSLRLSAYIKSKVTIT